MRLKVEMGNSRDKPSTVKTEDGELIEGIKSVEWHADAVERPRVVVVFYAEKLDFDTGTQIPFGTEPEPADAPGS